MKTTRISLLAWLVAGFLWLPSDAAESQQRNKAAIDAEGRAFQSGQGCARLAVINTRKLWLAVLDGNESGTNYMCLPEVYYDCRDYTSYVTPYLRMEWAPDGYHCRMVREI